MISPEEFKKSKSSNEKGQQEAQHKIIEIDPAKQISNRDKCKWAKFTSSNTEAQIIFKNSQNSIIQIYDGFKVQCHKKLKIKCW